MDVKIEASWKNLLADEFQQPYFVELTNFVKAEYSSTTIYPPGNQNFQAFDACPVEEVKVVILGQDPYHGQGQAHGLSFSVQQGLRVPPSLQNIFKEIESDIGNQMPGHGSLLRWAKQGVLLLNATLTVRASTPGSHQKKGWEVFTDAVIRNLSDSKSGLVFMLWGAYAQKKGDIIDADKHLVLKAAHPSPFAAHKGFFGCRHFSKANTYLEKQQKATIIW